MLNSKTTHLEFIQSTIQRMSQNSFSLKGWTVTLVAGVFALAAKDADKSYFLIAYIPIVVFWGLDSYYLLQERLYRALYDKVRRLQDDSIDYSMDTTPEEFHTGKNNYWRCVLSKTESGFYFPLAIICALTIWITT